MRYAEISPGIPNLRYLWMSFKSIPSKILPLILFPTRLPSSVLYYETSFLDLQLVTWHGAANSQHFARLPALPEMLRTFRRALEGPSPPDRIPGQAWRKTKRSQKQGIRLNIHIMVRSTRAFPKLRYLWMSSKPILLKMETVLLKILFSTLPSCVLYYLV